MDMNNELFFADEATIEHHPGNKPWEVLIADDESITITFSLRLKPFEIFLSGCKPSGLKHRAGINMQLMCHVRNVLRLIVHNFLSKRMLGELKKCTKIEIGFTGSFYRGYIFPHPENSAVPAWLPVEDFSCLGSTASNFIVKSHKKWRCIGTSFTCRFRTNL